MNLNTLIEEYTIYVKNNNKFKNYKEDVEKFTTQEFILSKVIKLTNKKIYQVGKNGKDSFIRRICNKDLMGTHFGSIFPHIKKFFYEKDSINQKNFNIFFIFLNALKNLKSNSDFYSRFKKEIVDKGYLTQLSSIKTTVIQIVACYFRDYFLPVYQLSQLESFIKYMEINVINLEKQTQEILRIKNDKDDGRKLLLLNQLLINKKDSNNKLKSLDNIAYTHFLFTCLPVERIDTLRKVNINLKYFYNNEQFVVALFLKIHKILGYPFITRIQTSFPDAEVEDLNGEILQVEFEYRSSAYDSHLPKKCDIIVCWEDNLTKKKKQTEAYKDIKIIELKKEILQL